MIKKFEQINQSITHSKKVIKKIQLEIEKSRTSIEDYISIYAVGSYGRLEASADASDFEWLFVYDDKRVNQQEAVIYQAKLTETFANIFGREKLSIGKTFGKTIAISNLISNIGGIADTNRMLTYRMLCLAEGSPLLLNKTHNKIIAELTKVYGGSHTAGHRMLSFATDIARYWRTLRIDYKQKVDEGKLPWAVRGMKLRGNRRFWYFSMAMYFIANGPRINYSEREKFDLNEVFEFMFSLSMNPSLRLINSINKLGACSNSLDDLLKTYDEYVGIISQRKIRQELDMLKFKKRYKSEVYLQLRDLLKNLHSQMADIIIELPEEPKKQIIEMFLL